MSNNCIFCQIVQKKLPSSNVYEDDKVLAFMDIRPVNEGHTLVIPKQHYEGILDIPEELNAYVNKIVKRIAVAVQKATHADGLSIIQQNGKAANQDIFHLHVHIIPKFEGRNTPRFRDLSEVRREQLDQITSKIKSYLLPPLNSA
ncbi:MAG: HIT family protein [Candidatus Bathyarchaeota archaeon]|nr:HIT family protein [Candidatus Bathyarchaeota archaeon]